MNITIKFQQMQQTDITSDFLFQNMPHSVSKFTELRLREISDLFFKLLSLLINGLLRNIFNYLL